MPAMDEDRKKWIVREIETWRRGKLLPEHYCDFLQNLYLDDLSDRPRGKIGTVVQQIGQAPPRQWLLVIGIISLICLVVLHFSAFPLALQIALIGLGTAGFVACGAWRREKWSVRSRLLSGGSILFPLGSGMALLNLHGWNNGAGPVALLMLCSLVWIGCGAALKDSLQHWCGWLAIISLYAWVLSRHVPNPTWVEVQVFWLPAALLFAWLSWFVHVKFKSTGIVMFTTALLLYFMPEVYSAAFAVDRPWIQAQFIVKIAIAGLCLFRYRKHWMEWVA